MNLLIDPLPCQVRVGDADYPIATSFRDWIRFYMLLEDKEIKDQHRVQAGMQWYVGERPRDAVAAWQALLDFAMCKDIPKAGKQHGEMESTAGSAQAPCFSWLYDAPYVLGAFREVYGINLADSEMHWYTFFALFMALPDETPLKKRMALRQTNTAEIKDRKQKAQIRKAQRAIAIPRPALTAEQIGAAFM